MWKKPANPKQKKQQSVLTTWIFGEAKRGHWISTYSPFRHKHRGYTYNKRQPVFIDLTRSRMKGGKRKR